jgi:uncharacterized integral membrane protein
MGSAFSYHYAVWVGLVTFMVYNFHSLLKLDVKDVFPFFKTNYHLFILLVGSVLTGFFLVNSNIIATYTLVGACCVTILYFRSNIFHTSSGRQHFLLKPIMIGLVFGWLTSMIPYLMSGYTWLESSVITAGRVAFIASLSLIFDIGDVQEDAHAHFVTMPQKWGMITTKIIATILLGIAITSDTIAVNQMWIEFPLFISFLATYILSFVLLVFAAIQRADWYYLLFVDGLLMLPWCLSFI